MLPSCRWQGTLHFFGRKLASEIGYDGEGDAVERILKGTYTLDTTCMDEIYASSEMKIVMAALKKPETGTIGEPVEDMDAEINVEHYREVFN